MSGGASTPIITINDVWKHYRLGSRRVEAVRGVDLVIDEPGFYAIMGPSGSGKSTLLHLLAGLDRPDRGTIDVAGSRIDSMNESELTRYRRLNIGLVFQQFNLIPTLSAVENVALPALLDRRPAAERLARAHELLDRFGLANRASHRPEALSGGEQQRVAIARALLFDPPVLFADEPSGNLDSATSAALWRFIRDLVEETARTVVMVTHEPAAALHCRRVFLLSDGRITDTFETEDLDAAELATRAQQPLA